MRTQESLTYNSRHQIRLSGFNGLVTSLTIIARIAGVTTRVDKVELLDPQGMSLSGGAPIDFGYVNTILQADENRYSPTPGDISLESALWFKLPVGGDDEAASNNAGRLNGYIPMSSLHQLAVYINHATNATVAVEFSILYESTSILTVNRGICSVSNS
jgi:hypothetical protein